MIPRTCLRMESTSKTVMLGQVLISSMSSRLFSGATWKLVM